MKRLVLAVALLLSIGGSANAWYLCAPSTPPAWPGHGWCAWQPSHSGMPVPGVQDCAGSAPTWGFVWLYSGESFAGSCAAVPVGPLGGDGVYRTVANYTWVELNGWWSFTPTVITTIRSIRLGPGIASWGGTFTDLVMSAGPDPTPPVVDIYPKCTFHNPSNVAVSYASLANSCPAGNAWVSFNLSAL
jgi:hypothetical protein